MITYDALRSEYAELWATMTLRDSKLPEVTATAKKIIAGKSRYLKVEKATGVPWWVVGVLHQMEAGGDFDRCLHNGDSIHRKTVNVPKGRGPFESFEASADDAIAFDGLNKVTSWDAARVCYEVEKFNGFGYRRFHPDTLSPYLWSGTNHYTRGKYVSDGKWSSTAVSGQSGAMALIKRIAELDSKVTMEAPVLDPADAFRKAPDVPEKRPIVPVIRESKSLWAIMTASAIKITQVVSDWLGLLPDVQTEAAKSIDPLTSLGGWLGANIAWMTSVVVLSAFAIVFVRHLNDKRAMPAPDGSAP
jgi:lysozyme family protein